MDLNHRPRDYEPRELPDCSTPPKVFDALIFKIGGRPVTRLDHLSKLFKAVARAGAVRVFSHRCAGPRNCAPAGLATGRYHDVVTAASSLKPSREQVLS